MSPDFRSHPDPTEWDDYTDYESKAWPRKERRRYWIIPSICFNCESACGIISYVDKETLEVRKIEGNPVHPGSRGRTCAKGVVTPNQLEDPDRILYPMRREGKRGSGTWRRVTWDEALTDIGGRIRRAIQEGRRRELMYHVGRPGEDGYANRVLQCWGIDGHNSHTNVCSSSARLGHFLWTGADRPSPDYANARTILLLSSHLESGHYFNPHAQRIMEGKASGATLIVIDPRLSNSSAKADLWLPAYSGTEGALLLAIAKILLDDNLFDREFVRTWVNWREYLAAEHAGVEPTFDNFIAALRQEYAEFTPEFAERETGVAAAKIVEAARAIARAGDRFATHSWRAAAAGNLWGWQITRCLYLLVVLTGSVGSVGGVNLHVTNKFVPKHPNPPPAPGYWNELLFPREFPLAFFEMSFLLPHFLKEGRGRLDTYFTRVYNPLWTNPDGFTWMEVLQDESLIGCHVALTPIWSETAWFADYVLPMGLGTERHDVMSQETHAAKWIGFRQPVLRVAREKRGEQTSATWQANPGEVWEENEFWIALSWAIDPDGSLGIRRYFESPYRPGERITVDEYYRWIFENAVPGLPEAAAREKLTPLAYMRKYGVFQVEEKSYSRAHERALGGDELTGTDADDGRQVVTRDGAVVGALVDGVARAGFTTPTRRLELYSKTLTDWGWPEHALPRYVPGHVHWRELKRDEREFDLLPNFRLPTLIHTRSPVKWLYEISHSNPLWISTPDARRLAIATGDLVKVSTQIGYFVTRAWVTEGIRPGILAMSHHLGRWRLHEDQGGARAASSLVRIARDEQGRYVMHQVHGAQPFESADPDSGRIWWTEVGVHQNLTFPVQPDPVSGMHCWHQRVRLEKAAPSDSYGDIMVDTARSHEIYKEWMARTRPAPGPGGLRRPLWFDRPLRPVPSTYNLAKE
ncbi:MAG TPA: molybdopterin-dependent oxidoreductase [Vicinamibacterales bacterium]|jgi:anaerobic selenocysteine-containing dehydrogenase|nr:molybdopterin-dependent oxidoreductase [Vicinamibacterales bacterium]